MIMNIDFYPQTIKRSRELGTPPFAVGINHQKPGNYLWIFDV